MQQLQYLAIEYLIPSKYQPRKNFNQEELQQLAVSIKTTGGLLQPLVVRKISTHTFEIIAGERRWRAMQIAGFTQVPCLVVNYSNEQAFQAAIIENVNRSNLNPLEEAQAYQRLIDEFEYSHEEIAATTGQSRVAVTNLLRLLKLDHRLHNYLINEQLSAGHGKILVGLDPEKQLYLAQACIAKQWSVRKLEQEVRQLTSPIQEYAVSDPNIKALEQALSEHMGNQVKIEYTEHGKGYLQIHFNNIEELEGHFARINFTMHECL